MAKSSKTNETSKLTVINPNPANGLPDPNVEDNTTTKGSKTKPQATEDKTPTKRELFKTLRQWLKLDTSEAEINAKAGELINNGISPLEAVKQAKEACKGLAGVECSQSEFLAKVSEFPQLNELLNSVHLSSLEGVTLTRCGSCVSYHPASTGEDSNTEDNTEDNTNTNRVKDTIKSTVLGVTCVVDIWYQLRPSTWSNWVLALRTQDLAKCVKSGTGAEILSAKRDFLNSLDRLRKLGVQDDKIVSLI